MKLSKNNLLITSALCSSVMALAVQAQDSAADTDGLMTFEEIMVTAQRRSERLQDVPIAITVATAEQIKRDQIYSLTDLQRITPALEVSQTFGGESNGGGRVRGIGTNVFTQTTSGSVAVVIDQVPQGNTSFSQVFDLAQVEVLRGPQGTLFGQTASAGVINITTADPDPSEFYVTAGLDFSDKGTAGSEFGQQVFRAVINAPTSETSALRLAAFYKKEIGLQKNVWLDQDNEIRDLSLRLKFLTDLSDTVTLKLSAEYNDNNTDGDNFFSQAKAPTNPGSLAAQAACGVTITEAANEYCSENMPNVRVENLALTAQIDWQMENHSLTSLTSYRKLSRDENYRDYGRTVGVALPIDRYIGDKGDQISQEFRLTSDLDGALNYVVGVYGSQFDFSSEPNTDAPYGDPFNPVGFSVCTLNGFFCAVPPGYVNQDASVDSYAVFADGTYEVSEETTLFAGLRYTRHETTSVTGLNGVYGVPGSVADNNLSGRLGFRYTLSDDAMIYGSAARGFKGSAFDISNNPTVAPTRLTPELTTAFELGAKFKASDTISVEANLFYTIVQDMHIQTSIFSGTELVSKAINLAEKVHSKGFEITLLGSLGPNFTFNSGYIFNDIKYPDNFIGDGGLDLSGLQFIFSPKHKFSLSGEYSVPVSDEIEGFLNANAVYKSDTRLSSRGLDDDGYVYPSHINLGASIGVRSVEDTWRISIYARNLTGEDEPAAYLANTFFGVLDGGIRAWPVAGLTARQVGISADFRF